MDTAQRLRYLLFVARDLRHRLRPQGSNDLSLRHRVNLHWYSLNRQDHMENIGDALSPVVVEYMLRQRGLSLHTPIRTTRHLYAIGSLMHCVLRHATIWGTGYSPDIQPLLPWLRIFHYDIRLVRGPLTAQALRRVGIPCPDTYGDPAVLMPLIYQPTTTSHTTNSQQFDTSTQQRSQSTTHQSTNSPHSPHLQQSHSLQGASASMKRLELDQVHDGVLLIKHMHSKLQHPNAISMLGHDYRDIIDRITQAKLVVSSSLHGIILAEVYGIPAVYIQDGSFGSIMKVQDYYASTGRSEFPVAHTMQEALAATPAPLPDFTKMQQTIISTFPYDLWQ